MTKDEAMKRFTRDDTEHGVEYYRADEVDDLMAEQPEQLQGPVAHRDGFWCTDLTCKKCYSADFRFKHTSPPAQQEPVAFLHEDAARYATNRKNAYIEAMKRKEADHMSEKALNDTWLAHYEGYREGYWVVTGDSKFSTNPAKLKEENT